MWLPLVCPQLETWPATQACALNWELNQQLFGSQAGTQSTEPYQPGLAQIFEGKIRMCIIHGNNNPVYNAHENMGAHYPWEHIIHGKIWVSVE